MPIASASTSSRCIITEVLLHLSGYVGVPLSRDALMTASQESAVARTPNTASAPKAKASAARKTAKK